MTFKLYPYQEEAVQRMYMKEGFLLADEMGLGKTVMALEEVRRRMEQHEDMKVLVVTTKSARSVWEDHAEWLLPSLPILKAPTSLLSSKGRYQTTSTVGSGIVVTNWDQLRVNASYKKLVWTYVLADEAHYMKNRKAKRTQAMKLIRGKYKRALTGTPIINRPDELWSILNWLYPQVFKSYWRFFEQYVDYWTNPKVGYREIKGPKNVDDLRATIRPFTIRRLKKMVLKELPDKYYTDVAVDMSPAQNRIYQEMKKDALAWVGEHEDQPVPAPMAIAKLTRLRMFCCAYANVTKLDDGALKVQLQEPSSKLDALMDILESTDKQVVVFSQFKQMVNLAIARFKKAGISHVVITGDVGEKARGQAIENFQRGRARVFIATTTSGGVGITLTAASTCVFLDRSWSPATNLQAEDRLHRIGQEEAVQIISIQARDSVDQVVEKALTMKWDMIKRILGG